jgi:hypothetical protein
LAKKQSKEFSLTISNKDVSLEQWKDISSVLIDGIPKDDPERSLPLHRYLSNRFDLSTTEVLTVLTHPTFCKYLAEMKKALAKAEFLQHSYDALLDILKNGSDRNRIAAVKELAVQLGERQPDGPQVSVKIENVIREAQAEGETIDAEAVEIKRYPGC